MVISTSCAIYQLTILEYYCEFHNNMTSSTILCVFHKSFHSSQQISGMPYNFYAPSIQPVLFMSFPQINLGFLIIFQNSNLFRLICGTNDEYTNGPPLSLVVVPAVSSLHCDYVLWSVSTMKMLWCETCGGRICTKGADGHC